MKRPVARRVPVQCHLVIGKDHGITMASCQPCQYGEEAIQQPREGSSDGDHSGDDGHDDTDSDEDSSWHSSDDDDDEASSSGETAGEATAAAS